MSAEIDDKPSMPEEAMNALIHRLIELDVASWRKGQFALSSANSAYREIEMLKAQCAKELNSNDRQRLDKVFAFMEIPPEERKWREEERERQQRESHLANVPHFVRKIMAEARK